MYVVTGGAGFIGSAVIARLNAAGIHNIIVVDNLAHSHKWKNLVNLRYEDYFHRNTFMDLLLEEALPFETEAIIHMGACSATTETDADFLMENNYRYSVTLARYALHCGARFIGASSAATYGDGTLGFSDEDSLTPRLRPLNMYGYSKQLVDLWALREGLLGTLVSLKFFNVFGPNEYHKGTMRSVVCKAYEQITQTGSLKLFRSHHPEYAHGEQLRDFIYVRDCTEIIWWLLQHPEVNGIFNVGTGISRTWNDLAAAVFTAMKRPENIIYTDMPEQLRDAYQYYTQASMDKLHAAGCPVQPRTLEDAVTDYVSEYLATKDPYLEGSVLV